MKFGTKAIHAGVEPEPHTGAIMTPIFQTSTYIQSSPGDHKGFEYSRTQNPTRTALQSSIAALENGKYGISFASGLSAIDSLIKTLEPGDEVIASNDLYGGTFRLYNQIFAKFGVVFHFIAMEDSTEIEQYINEKTKLIWIETPSNPLLNIIDIGEAVQIARDHNLLLGVDNTFATPYLQNPLDLGADVVMHSVTKYLGGHSDVIQGALVLNDDTLAEKLYFMQNSTGAVPGPMDCFLVLRGIKTLHLRMEAHSKNGMEVAKFLHRHVKVRKVFYPGLEDHPNHQVAVKQMRAFGGMVSFEVEGNREDTLRVCEKFKVFSLGESLGGVESLANHPAIMTHASVPPEVRQKIGINDNLIRLSVGIEEIEDLIQDLEQALS